jgi:ankyrin repeat protein
MVVRIHRGQLASLSVNRGVAIDARTSDGSTALSGAAVEGDTVMVGFLLARGATLNLPGDTGSKALAGAQDMQHTEFARTLLQRGAKPVCYARELAVLDSTIASRDTAFNVILAHYDGLQRSWLQRDARLQDSLLALMSIRTHSCPAHPGTWRDAK